MRTCSWQSKETSAESQTLFIIPSNSLANATLFSEQGRDFLFCFVQRDSLSWGYLFPYIFASLMTSTKTFWKNVESFQFHKQQLQKQLGFVQAKQIPLYE